MNQPPVSEDATVVSVERLSELSNLTRSQLMIWMGQQLEPESPLYNMVLCFHFAKRLDADCFRSAFSTLITQSDALRSVIEVVNGVPVQRVLPGLNYRVELVDLTRDEDPQQALSEWLERHNRQRFDLARCSFESTLLLTGDDGCIWYLNQHHLTTDAWSTALIYRRMSELYAASVKGQSESSGTLPAWGDYIAFERDRAKGGTYEKAVDHWQQRASHQIDPLRFYGRRPLLKGACTKRVACRLDQARSNRLRELALSDGFCSLNINMTLFHILLVVLSAWLYRISDSRSMVIGAPAHNRSSMAFRNTIGLLIEMFPLVVEHEQGQTFRELFGRIVQEAHAWLRHAQPGTSSMAGTRQFSVVLNFIHAIFPPFGELPVEAEWVHTGYGDPRHDLRLQVHDFDESGRFLLYFDFNRDAFPDGLQQRAVQHFLGMLDAFLDNPDCPIDKVALATEEEQQRYLIEYNRTESPARPTATVLDLFRLQCRKSAKKAALLLDDRQLSYRDLDLQSDRLAALLQQRGCGAGRLIGIHLKRSIEMVVAVLGVLKAGAGYVPLESALPDARLEFILHDTGIGLVLTDRLLAQRLARCGVDTLCMEDWESAAAGTGQPVIAATPDDTAYVIYTSGSTGRPKGVVVQHRGLHEYICWAAEAFTQNAALNFPLYSSFGFDLTVTSLFVPLSCGGAIVVYPEDDGAVDLSIIRVFEENRSDVVKLTPAHLRLVLTMAPASRRVKRFILGGEDLKRELCNRAIEAFGKDIVIYNEYGPTEAVVGCMIHRFDPAAAAGSSVPIGRPAANTRIYLLDEARNPVPQGVAGEIYIGRTGLAPGYLGREDLTRERFVDDPFVPGQTMYRSGDLARFRTDAVMEYLGRADDQVKIRGVRIELAEIEHALLEHPVIKHCTLQVIQPDNQPEAQNLSHCARCGLASNYPGVSFDARGICNICNDFAGYGRRAHAYFRSMDELAAVFDRVRRERKGDYDCLMLFSGGKDSTYALARVVGMGMKVLAFTLDNGFISDGAKTNIRRVVDELGVDHLFGQTPHMNQIFVDSLERHSNVCQGCFKVIYTLSMQLAIEHNIACIVTGLSRGQFFETRLTPELFCSDSVDVEGIDRMVLDARKAYHRVDDAVSRLMDVSLFRNDRVFDAVEFVDFYRYCDVDLVEMLAYLAEKLPWIRPEDTGRSTNCLINDVGIHVHQRKERFHNYALPYSWDVRLGVKRREEALQELNDEIDQRNVFRILNEIGYDERAFFADPDEKKLSAYFTAAEPLSTSGLRAWLESRLPAAMVPDFLIQLDRIPLTGNGKIDRCALPHPEQDRSRAAAVFKAPQNGLEAQLAAIWRSVLRLERISADDRFLDLGGDSITAIQIVARANSSGIRLTTQQMFQHHTVAELAAFLSSQPEERSATAQDRNRRPDDESTLADRVNAAGVERSELDKLAALLSGKS